MTHDWAGFNNNNNNNNNGTAARKNIHTHTDRYSVIYFYIYDIKCG